MKSKFTVVSVVVLICVAFGFGLWTWSRSQIANAFEQNETIQAHLGPVKVVSVSLSGVREHLEGHHRFLVSLEGEKGVGQAAGDILLQYNVLEDMFVAEGILCLPNGEVIRLTEDSLILKSVDGSIGCK